MIDKEVDQHKKRVFSVLLLFTFLAGFFFAYINYHRNFITISVIEIIASLISAWLLFIVQKTKTEKLRYIIIIYLAMFFSIMIFVFSSKGVSNTVFVWVYCIPLVSYLLLGLRLGFIYSLIFYSISAVIFFNEAQMNGLKMEGILFGNVLISAGVIWGLSHAYENANHQAKTMLRKLAIFDKLTGLYNRTHLTHKFIQIKKQAINDNNEISIIAFDLDLFKKINDEFGHTTGDLVLQIFAKIITANLPPNANAFRLGGEEFSIIMISQFKSHAFEIAEKIRVATENISNINPKVPRKFTVSSGINTQNPVDTDFESMMVLADKRMYLAKEKGRNCIVTEG